MANFVIRNAQVFDGQTSLGKKDIYVSNGIICDECQVETVIDGHGCTLLPGLIDSHIHLLYPYIPSMASRQGVTGLVECGVRDLNVINDAREMAHAPHFVTHFQPVFGPNSVMWKRMNYDESCCIHNEAEARQLVAERKENGAVCIKVIVEVTNNQGGVDFPDDMLDMLVRVSHEADMRVHAHVTDTSAFEKAARAGVDIISHMPFDREFTDEQVVLVAQKGIICVPTLVMMEGIMRNIKKHMPQAPITFDTSLRNLEKLRKAGVKMVVGTDANLDDDTPYQPAHGTSLHREMVLMTKVGYSPEEVIRMTTVEPAQLWGFDGCGMIAQGMKADMLLVWGNPLDNIESIRNVRQVWIGGVEV